MGYHRGGAGAVFQPKDPIVAAYPRKDMGSTPAYSLMRRVRGGLSRGSNLMTPSTTPINTSRDRYNNSFGGEEGMADEEEGEVVVELKPSSLWEKYMADEPATARTEAAALASPMRVEFRVSGYT